MGLGALTVKILEVLEKIPVVGSVFGKIFDKEPPRVKAIKILGNTQDGMVERMGENADNPREVIDPLTEVELQFMLDDRTITKNVRQKSPFEN